MAYPQQQRTCATFLCPVQALVRCHTHRQAQSLLTHTLLFSLHLTLDQQLLVHQWPPVHQMSRMPLICLAQLDAHQLKVLEVIHWGPLERPLVVFHDSSCSAGHALFAEIASRAFTMVSFPVRAARASSNARCRTKSTMFVSEELPAQLLWLREKSALPAVLTNVLGRA